MRQENERDPQRTDELQRRVDEMSTQQGQKAAADDEHVRAQVEKEVASGSRRYLERYWGSNRFVLNGWVPER